MLRIKLFILTLACAGLFLTSCEDDLTGTGPGGNNLDAPNLALPGGLDIISDGAIVEPGSTFRVLVEGNAVLNDLNGLTVLLDGANLATTDFTIVEITDPLNNPIGLFGDNANSFSFTFEITAPTEAGFFNYDFVLVDNAVPALSSTQSLGIEVMGAPVDPVDPMLSVASATVIEVPANTLLSLNVSAVMGTFDIASISVWENGALIEDLSRIRFNTIDFDSNPMPLFSPDTEGFDAAVALMTTTGTNTYVIRITDTEDNNSDFVFDVVEEVDFTELDGNFTMVLFSNNAGAELGGVDLDNGVAVTGGGANTDPSPMAEIIDAGIDTAEPAASNWLQQIEPVNGSELRIVDLSGLPDGFTFAAVSSQEEVQDAFDSATTVAITPSLQVGDLLAVAGQTNTFLVRIDEVNATTTDNLDNYSISVKF